MVRISLRTLVNLCRGLSLCIPFVLIFASQGYLQKIIKQYMLTVYLPVLPQLSYCSVSSANNLASDTTVCDYDATGIVSLLLTLSPAIQKHVRRREIADSCGLGKGNNVSPLERALQFTLQETTAHTTRSRLSYQQGRESLKGRNIIRVKNY